MAMLTKHLLPALIFLGFTAQAPLPPAQGSDKLANAATPAKPLIVKSNDPHIHYMGRVRIKDGTAELSWTATSVDINFTGTGARALLKDEKGDNYYNIIVDGRVVAVIHPDQSLHLYDLVTGLPAGRHRLELFKRTESVMGKTWLYQFEFDPKTVVSAATPTKKRKIEFFGNSITCGYAVEDTSGRDRGTSPYENAYISYAAITARHFDAELYSVSRSGIGIMVSWFPLIMPEMYDRLDGGDPNSKWDFSRYRPDLVVINLFQNDCWLVNLPTHEQFRVRFGATAPAAEQIITAYRAFVRSVRDKYPRAKIICALGSMDATRPGASWPGYIEKAVGELHDKNIFTHFFPYKGTPGHPSAHEQLAMADDLIAYIDKNIKW